ncbi:SURF6 homolog gldi-11 [Caenorhabditis elegans]|uniref:SURF6 homolog gldi-11 n=2 Tax=Caenorhabditis elegans TaxID=6239 RepID=SURF6_CAEEL|nr:SURF6 domain-containing protein [Caenorhabditis elegans]Q23525.1 RecName: Full=Uncharacterized protein ZK546.14 [Caenorhabditis elegans]CCD73224.1 SURF6 domain-containing protein [Caenorhabditis elegans]|eukprot:NP_494907.1 Uncharacterized protein CELE_ZK546.14 [Caenorhabditis elegans]
MAETLEAVEDAVDILEKEMLSFCNLIPVNSWGFDDDVKESLKMRKHSLVNRQLSKKERKSMSAQQKQHLAKGLGLVPNTVQEVLEWMSKSKQHSKVQPQKVVAPVKRPADQNKNKEKVVKKDQKKQDKKADSDSEEDDSSDDEEKEETDEPVAKKQKKEESSDDDEDSEDGEEPEGNNGAVEAEDSDSTDEEEETPSKPNKTVAQSTLKSNGKIDKEIQKLEDDEDNESPEIRRQIALLRLQKKLKEMKVERKGKGPAKVTSAMAEKMAEEKRLKRRESKLKLKQRRAEEKKGKEAAAQVKKETVESTENGNEPVEKQKSGISFNNLKFEIKEDKQRGKKQRTAKKDRALKLTGRDYKSLIAKVEETKATIAKVREADPHKATIMEDELKWEKTLKRAAGGKVKDNLGMLKKALVKKNKMKDRRKQKWENRENKTEGEKQTKQDKRKKNLQKRIDDVKKRKMNKLRNKGRIL